MHDTKIPITGKTLKKQDIKITNLEIIYLLKVIKTFFVYNTQLLFYMNL